MDRDIMDCPCRLCGSETRPVFQKMLMYKHKAQYFECQSCGCLQTEPPYWLDEAYRDARRFTDTFGGVRAAQNQALTYFLFRVLGLRQDDRVVDWGGGDGLTTRVLRDVGLDAYSCDRYAQNSYAAGFDGVLEPGLGMVTSFEVWEHFAEPASELAALFACGPKALFISTGSYLRQGEQWPYLGPYSGRHIFFYSPKGMEWVAKKFGYDHEVKGDYVVFSRKPLSGLQRKAIRVLFSGRLFRFLRVWLAMRPPKGLAGEDHIKMRRQVNDGI